MKILLINPSSLRHGGGGEVWMFNLIKALKENFGHEFTIIDTTNAPAYRLDEKSVFQNIHDSKLVTLKTVHIPFFNYPVPPFRHLFKIVSLLKNSDVAYYFIDGFFHNAVIILARLLSKKKIIGGYHAPLNRHYPMDKVNYFLSRYILSILDTHHVINTGDQHTLSKRWGLKNVFYIPNGIETSIYQPLEKKLKEKSKLKFLFVGRIEKDKGIDLLLEGIDIFLKDEVEDIEFNIVGSGGLSSLVIQAERKHECINYLGFIEDMVTVYNKNDVLILPSRYEPFGLVVIEAMSCELPVICSKTSGPMEIVIEDETGFFLESVDPESIAQSIQKVYNLWKTDPKHLKKMGENARTAVVERFSIEKTMNQLNSMFQKNCKSK